MVPQTFTFLEELPLTTNGKVNKRLLPKPDQAQAAKEWIGPRNATEETIAHIWSDILGRKQIGIHDDFFALGGHSLKAMTAASRIKSSVRTFRCSCYSKRRQSQTLPAICFTVKKRYERSHHHE